MAANGAPTVAEREYRLLFDANPNPMWVFDAETLQFVAVNEAAVAKYGYTREQFLSMTILEIRPEEDRESLEAFCKTELPDEMVWRHRTEDGAVIDVAVTATAITFEGRPARLVLAHDVTTQQRAKEAIRESEARYRELFENANEPIATVDLEGVITEVNKAFGGILGYSRDELVGANVNDFVTDDGRMLAAQARDRKLSGAEGTTYEQTFIAKDGREVVFEVATRLIREDGEAVGVQGMCRDVTERKQSEADLRKLAALNRHQARHDALTHLPNRLNFREAIQLTLVEAVKAGASGAVLVIDLNRFKEINDTLGHLYGDLLLEQVATRLSTAVRPGSFVARLGGDEFGILIRDLGDDDTTLPAAIEQIELSFKKPFAIQELPITVDASVGAATYPGHGSDVDTLLRRADVAMYSAKGKGELFALYAPEHDRHDLGRLLLLGELRAAIESRQIVVHYQPKADLRNGRIEKVEALVRWEHPERGLILPEEFIALAEQTGLIGALTFHVLEEALRQQVRWTRLGHDLVVSVNLSGRVLTDPELPARVEALLHRHGVPADKLVLEITESALIAESAPARQTLTVLAGLGVLIAVDDFGTGYSSLAYLSQLPLHQIKIDRSFITDLLECEENEAIVRSVIHLGHELGLEIVAEGVETAEVWARLSDFGCDIVQGYYLSRPLTADAIIAVVSAHGRSPVRSVAA